MREEVRPASGHLRAAEVIAALSLATDLGIGVPLEHGLQSTLFATRLSERLGVDVEAKRNAYYICLLFYVGCTAGAELATDVFGADTSLTTHATPVRFGSRAEMTRGMLPSASHSSRAEPRPARASLGSVLAPFARRSTRQPDRGGDSSGRLSTSIVPRSQPLCHRTRRAVARRNALNQSDVNSSPVRRE